MLMVASSTILTMPGAMGGSHQRRFARKSRLSDEASVQGVKQTRTVNQAGFLCGREELRLAQGFGS
jgi:hypothetical protein